MEVDNYLVEEVKRGKVVLLLGAGALFGAKFPEGKRLLLGDDLRDSICDEFLDGEFKGESLQFVAELACNASSLFALQAFVSEQFRGIEPADFHKKIPLFNWRAIFSTNYDLLIEDSYRLANNPLQKCRSIISNYDPLDEVSRTNDTVPLVKLHGCVSRPMDPELPFILTVDQYNDYMENRDRLFKFLYELGFENTLVFVGHSLKDANIRQIISLIEKNVGTGRPRYYLIKPKAKHQEVELWNSKRISVLDGSFEEFLDLLEEKMDENDRKLGLVRPPRTHPIQVKFEKNIDLRGELISFLINDVDYIEQSLLQSQGDIRAFYSGADQGWFPIIDNLDAPRTLTKKLLSDVVNIGEADRPGLVDFYVVKGEAGAGKSVLLRRLAWEAGISNDRLCLYVRPLAAPKFDQIEEIYGLAKERIFLFWDNAASNASAILKILRLARSAQIPLTVISCERYTEWNSRCEDIEAVVTGKYNLPYLGSREIEKLVSLLEKHDCLGPGLQPLTYEQRVQRFMDVFDRQLLVALHEVTMGEPFEEIIYDEYQSLQPESAKALYRTICVLNRLRVPVRAGLIARVFGITFEDFSSQFFKPLQKVVLTTGRLDHDVHYIARHPEIAEIVFRRAFDSAQDRYHEYVRIIKALNISYESDRQSFRSMVRAKNLMDLFPDYEDVRSIYEITIEAIGRDSYVLQQMANFERRRDNGSLREAIDLLREAKQKAPHDTSISHSLAVVWRVRAERTEDALKREQFRREARSILNELIINEGHSPHIDSVLVELALADLRDVLGDPEALDRTIDDAIRYAEKILSDSKKRFPFEDYLLALEAEFASMLNDEPRAIQALEKAFQQDNRDPYIAIRLSSIYMSRGEKERSGHVLQRALEARRSDHQLNFAYGECLHASGDASPKDLAYFYQRAFTPGDKNYQAQFWFARFALETQDDKLVEKATATFNFLRKAHVDHSMRVKIRDYYGSTNSPKQVRGIIISRRATFGFIKVPEFSLPVFIHEDNLEEDIWGLVEVGTEILCHLGFNYTGLVCVDVELL